MKFSNTLVLTTPRLNLRTFIESDLVAFNRYAAVEGVGEMAGWPHHKSIDESLNILKMFIGESNVLALVDKRTDQVIGSIGVHASKFQDDEEFSGKKMCEIGYVLAKEYWGHGLMSEAVVCLLDYLFSHKDYDVISVGHFTTNNQSRRVIEKSGFVFHSEGQYFSKQLDKYYPELKYIVTKEMFNQRHH